MRTRGVAGAEGARHRRWRPTIVVAGGASFFLISATRIASTGTWLSAGVLVPIGALIGYFAPHAVTNPMGLGGIGSFTLLVVSIFIVPVGVVGRLFIRWLISRRFLRTAADQIESRRRSFGGAIIAGHARVL